MNKLIKLSFAISLAFSTLVYDNPCRNPCEKASACHRGQCIPIAPQQPATRNCHVLNYCSSAQSCVQGVCISTDRSTKCDKCLPGENCVYGKCIAGSINQNYQVAPCVPSCSQNYQCSHGQCVPKVQRCRGNGDCRFDEVCRQRKCVRQQIDKPCKFTCVKGYQCKYGSCIPVADVGGCGFDSDCGLNQVCLDRICVDRGSECAQVCPTGYACLKGQCVQNFYQYRACYDNVYCNIDEICVQGQCVPRELDYVGSIKE